MQVQVVVKRELLCGEMVEVSRMSHFVWSRGFWSKGK
jgi:hypothetical protein